MELQEIQDKLNALFSGTERRIVFWYDDDGAYEEEIDGIQLAEGNKVWKLNDHNWFETKLLLEERDTVSNYLVYAPFPRPEDKENSLADIFYYSQHFHTDRLLQLMTELSIPAQCQDEMMKYKKFWTSGNVLKFQKLQIADCTPEKLSLGILSVLAGSRTAGFEELMKKVFLAGVEENSILKKFVYYKIEDVFWKLCGKQYGYHDAVPSVEKFMISMVVTYLDALTEGHIPGEWKSFLSCKQNDAVVWVKNLMNHEETRAAYDAAAEKLAGKLNVESLARKIPLEYVVSCDAFEDFDRNIMDWVTAKIEDNMLDEKVAGRTISEICEIRSKNCCHFAEKYRFHYQILFHAYMLLKEVSLFSCPLQLQDMVEEYARHAYQIDTHYRKFYHCMDRVGMGEKLEEIRELVENIYTNKFLMDFSCRWNQALTEDGYRTWSQARQEDFFDTCVKPFMKEEGREGRVVVIISDGLRYECARELLDYLELDEKCDARMQHMMGVLPSETTLGMAALLPHREILVEENLEVTVDGMHCGNSMAERAEILRASVPKSACYDFDRVMNAKQTEIREMFQEKDLIYIYQNQIDGRGESGRSENEVFQACQEALTEIQAMIRRITGYVSVTRYLITADHGFLYKRDKLTECEKIPISALSADTLSTTFLNKRYLLSAAPVSGEAVRSRKMDYLGRQNGLYVTTPFGVDIIKSKGGGQNYVHGGSSPQEMIVPVIKVRTFTGRQDTELVSVELSSFVNKVTGIEVRLEFMQMEPVSDIRKPRKLVAFFEDAHGNKISYDVPLMATVRDEDARKRVMTEKFTLKSGRYSRQEDYFLVLVDMEDAAREYRRYRFEIDIADYS